MKFKVFIILIITILISSCSYKVINRFYNLKPSKNYYTSKLIRDIIYNNDIEMSCIETNFYKRFNLNSNERGEIIRFIALLKDEFFLGTEQIVDMKEIEKIKPLYKLTIDVNKNKYCIEILDENFIKIFNWDGNYVEDYIIIKNLPMGENLFYYLKYLYLSKKI